jgi:lipopolysaccharide export system protein LptA
LVGLSFCSSVYAQKIQPKKEKEKPEKVELLHAGELETIKSGGLETRYLRRSDSAKVHLKQEDMDFYCTEAIQFPDSNFVVAFGDVVIHKGDSITLTGDTLYYYGNDRVAEMWGNVYFTDLQMKLTAPQMEYDVPNNLASYQYTGKVTSDSTTLTSRKGYYNTQTQIVSFSKNVVLDNPTSNYHLESDTLDYNTNNRTAYFTTRTEITTADGKLIAEKGEYDTQFSKSIFEKNAQIETAEYILSGDFLDYDEVLEVGKARGNVMAYSKKDTIALYGDIGNYYGLEKKVEIFGNALVQKPFGAGDTLFLSADTLISINDSLAGRREMIAYPDVLLFSNNMQGIADSLAYNFTDSLIQFYDDPVLWSDANQMEADTIITKMRGNGIDKLFMRKNAFIASKDSLRNYNQIKGRDMTAQFVESNLRRVNVDGNAQNLYFALEKDTILIGMNRMDCSNMYMVFTDSNTLGSITSIKQVDAKLIPPHELKVEDTKLKGFNWREKERPTKAFVYNNPNWKAISENPLPVLVQPIPKEFLKEKILLDDSNKNELESESEYEKYGELVAKNWFNIYVNGDTVTLVSLNKNRILKQSNGDFYADIFPTNNSDLPDSIQAQGYEIISLKLESGQLKEAENVYRFVLPTYEKVTVRIGQIRREANEIQDQKDAWTEVFNYYDLKK